MCKCLSKYWNMLNDNFKTESVNLYNIINLDNYNSWGNNVYFSNYEKRRLTGWMTNKLKKNDYVSCTMTSGRRMIFKVIKVEDCLDPSDMFFATVEDVGYEDEIFGSE